VVRCIDTRFDDTAMLRLRYAEAVLYRAVFTKPSTIVFAENAFEPRDELPEETFDEGAVARATRGRSPRPWLLSLHGTDVATLTLTELDLGACVFRVPTTSTSSASSGRHRSPTPRPAGSGAVLAAKASRCGAGPAGRL
jgi:hypothetical protein